MTSSTLVPDRLNGIIRVLESGGTAFVRLTPGGAGAGFAAVNSPYDGVIFEMEHNPFGTAELRLTLQSMLDRREILEQGTIAPAVTPLVRIPPNGSEMNQWIAKQALDCGVYGLVWPHVSTVDEARNAVASARYPRPAGSVNFEPIGVRGDAPNFAAKYWGLGRDDYYPRADVWPLDPRGELLTVIMCEDVAAIKNLPRILEEVPGIGVVLIGEGDLSQELGQPRQYEHPVVRSAMDEIRDVCLAHDVVVGHPHVTTKNVDRLVEEGYRFLAAAPVTSYDAIEMGRRAVAAAGH